MAIRPTPLVQSVSTTALIHDVIVTDSHPLEWAGGPTNYGAGPYTMQVKSVSVSDYSTGTQYAYGGSSGTWDSIQAVGGRVGTGGGTVAGAAAPAVTSASNSAPIPFSGSNRDTNVYPWVANPTTLQTSTGAPTTYPGLPAGWTVTSSGKVLPPSAAPVSEPPRLLLRTLPLIFTRY